MRSPPAFSDISVKPSFLRTTPAKKPRTEGCCQPVAFIIVAIVVPLGCLSRARTAANRISPFIFVCVWFSLPSNRVAHEPQELQLPQKPPHHHKNADTNSDGEQHEEHRTGHLAEPAVAIALNVFF